MTATANLAIAAVGLGTGVLAARLLGPRGRGELAAIQTWPATVAGLATIGMPEAVVYYSARRSARAGRYFCSSLLVALSTSIPFMLLAYVCMPLLLHAQVAGVIRAGRWYLLLVPIYALTVVPPSALRGRGDFVPWNVMRLAPNVLWLGILLMAWLCGRASPVFLAAANLFALAVLILPFIGLTVSRVPGPYSPRLRLTPALLRYGLPCMMTGVPQSLNLRLDQMLMAAFLPPRDLGLYVVAVAWSAAPFPLLSALSFATTPAVASASNAAEGARRFAVGVRTTAMLALVLCVGLGLVTPLAVSIIFGSRFRESIPAAVVLVGASGILGFNAVLQEGLRGLGQPYAVLQAEFAGLGVTLVALSAMLRPMGILGAALASLCGYAAVAAVLLVKAQRYTGMPMRTLVTPKVAEIRMIIARLATILFIASDPIEQA